MFSTDFALESLARIVEVVGQDPDLRGQFQALARMSSTQRRNTLYAMIEQVRARGNDADTLAAFHLLADDRVFAAAGEAMGMVEP